MTQKPSETRIPARRRGLIVLAVIAVFAALVVVGQLTLDRGTPSAPGASPASDADKPTPDETKSDDSADGQSTDSPLVRRDEGDPMALGEVDAPVVLIEWTDLRCPFCAAFARDTLPTIVEEYVDKGLVRVEVHDVSYFGQQSEDAAVAARAAAEQGRFFEYLDAVYAAAPEKGHADLPRDRLIAFAEKAGVPDVQKFTADLDDPALRAAAKESTTSSQQIGVSAVPFFLAGDTALSGAQPISVFRDYLDQAVEKAK